MPLSAEKTRAGVHIRAREALFRGPKGVNPYDVRINRLQKIMLKFREANILLVLLETPPFEPFHTCYRTRSGPRSSLESAQRWFYPLLYHTSELWPLEGACGAAVAFSYFFRIFCAFSLVKHFSAFLFSFKSLFFFN